MELLNPDFEQMLSEIKQRTKDSFELSQFFGLPAEAMGSLAAGLQRLSAVRSDDLPAKFKMLDTAIQKLESHAVRCPCIFERKSLVEHAFECRKLAERLASRLFLLIIVDRAEWSRNLANLRLKCGILAANVGEWGEARRFALSSLELEASASVRRRSVELLKAVDMRGQ